MGTLLLVSLPIYSLICYCQCSYLLGVQMSVLILILSNTQAELSSEQFVLNFIDKKYNLDLELHTSVVILSL